MAIEDPQRAAARAARQRTDAAGLTDSKSAAELRAKGDTLRARTEAGRNTNPADEARLAAAEQAAANRLNAAEKERHLRERDSQR